MKLIQRSFVKRALVAGLIAGGGLLAASSFATPAADGATPAGCAKHGQKAHGDWEEKRAQHLSALQEKLKLSPEQAAAWAGYTSTLQPAMHRGADRQAMRAEFDKLDTPARLDRMQQMAASRQARMAERSAAIKAFYAQLSAEQQAVFDAEAKFDRRGHGQHRHRS